MSLEDIGNIGELIGAIGVVLSLVFVGIQIMKNTNALQISNRETSTGRTIETTRYLATDPEIASLYLAGLQNYDEMTQPDKFRFSMILLSIVMDWLDEHLKYEDGLITEGFWSGNLQNIKATFNTPGAQQWLESAETTGIPPEFLDFIRKHAHGTNT
jgi:hypothetical protein